jgi:Tfp pilus assembly protein PilX
LAGSLNQKFKTSPQSPSQKNKAMKMNLKFLARNTKDKGFALIVTLSLMILLTVIAVGLLSLSSITVRGSSLKSARQTAQANARMAMMLAIGQLQKHAGVDQRITATADIAGGLDGIAAENGAAPANEKSLDGTEKGLSAVRPGTRHWTGVWKNRDDSKSIHTKTPAPEQQQWLVSGNEAQRNKATPATTDYDMSGIGGANAKAVVLVGDKSDGNIGANQKDYVTAPLVDIFGLGTSPGKKVGRYGWWVGDEGVKAKINLVAPYAKDDIATYKTGSSQRTGWEVVDGFQKYPVPGTPESASLGGVVNLSQIPLVGGAGAILRTSKSFHSATTESYGVLADVLQGGLRLDLTHYLRNNLPNSAPAGYPNGLLEGKNIIPDSVTNNIKGPKWEALKSFNDFATDNMEDNVIQTKAATSAGAAAIAPTLLELRLLFGARIEPVGPETFKVHPRVKIAVTLANPYPYPLTWTNPLEIEIKNALPFDPNSNPTRLFFFRNSPGPAFVPKVAGEAAVFNNTRFQIPGNGTLPAGGAIAYTISAPRVRAANSVERIDVPMVAIGPGSLASIKLFENCIELVNPTPRNLSNATPTNDDNVIGLDIREGNMTSQIDVEMRLAGNSLPLRKIEKLELDNANTAPTMRFFTTVAQMPKFPGRQVQDYLTKYTVETIENFFDPIPLQLYTFRLSQPGVSNATLEVNASRLGLLGSTLRTYADFNLQAAKFRKPIISYNPPPFHMYIADDKAALLGSGTGDRFVDDISEVPIHWGKTGNADSSAKTVLFCPPAPGESMVSLAQFQHADLTADDIYTSVGHQPGNAFGNSYASPFVTREKTVFERIDYQITGVDNTTTKDTKTNYYDLSYLLNASIWDTYYSSTIPATSTTSPINSRIVKLDPTDESTELRVGDKSSSRLLVNGAFNINSTNKDAWKAFLAGGKHLKHPADSTGSPEGVLFPRSLGQLSPSENPPSGKYEDSFSGYRRLNDVQLDALAEEITKQVRLRGPFVSLSHFINRALVPLTENKALGRSGALQSAIDLSGANIKPDSTGSNPEDSIFRNVKPAADKVILQNIGIGPRADFDILPTDVAPASVTAFKPTTVWPILSRSGNPGSVASILADLPMLNNNDYRSEQGFRSTGIPGWLTQADILQVIGPSIAARSDTFKIRSYGEALDATGNVIAKAWCEASVQRVPEYTDGEDKAYERAGQLGSLNTFFGRKFNLVSFRWLSPDEI